MKNKKVFKIIRNIFIILAIILTIGIIFIKNKILVEYPELKGTPEIGQWYRISPDEAKDSDGNEWHGLIKLGTENKVAVYFFGGGVSLTGETSQRGEEFYATSSKYQDMVATWGIGSNKDENPFKDLTFLVLPYSTGDFHTGTGEYKYIDSEGKEQTIYHNGYNNYSSFIEEAKKYVGKPDTLLVTGFSAGGFATSLLADDVIDHFPSATNTTVAVDSSLLLYDDWQNTAENLWKSPKEISDRLTGDNIVLDSLVALKNKRGKDVKILFDCSVRDDALQQYQNYIDEGEMSESKKTGDIFQKDLKQMVKDLQENIDDVGIFIWDLGRNKKTQNTQHTIISSSFFKKLDSGKSISDWLIDAVNGKVMV